MNFDAENVCMAIVAWLLVMWGVFSIRGKLDQLLAVASICQ